MANTTQFQFAGGSKVYVQAVTNAGYTQQVKISPPDGVMAVLQGRGEGNVAMNLTTPGFMSASSTGGQPFFVVPGASNQLCTYTVAVSYEKGGVFQPSNVDSTTTSFSTPAGGTIHVGVVGSEDDTDDDYNDSVVLFITYPSPSPV